jgi:hypothetical protein
VPDVSLLALRAAASVGPTGTPSSGQIGRHLSGLLGARLVKKPEPPKSVCAEIIRSRVPAC